MDDDDGSLGIRNWGFYDTMKGNLGLQLMSSMPPDRDTKPLLPRAGFLQQHGHHNASHQLHAQQSQHYRDSTCGGGASGGMPTEQHSIHMDFSRNEAWLHPSHHHQHPHDQKVLHSRPTVPAGHVGHPGHGSHPVHGGHIVHHHPTGYGSISDAQHTLQMMQPQLESQLQEPPPCKGDEAPPPPIEDHSVVSTGPPVKKRQRGQQQSRQPKSPKPKKPKKVAVLPEGGALNGHAPRRRGPKKAVGMVINGIELDLANLPTPVCSCTGTPQQCYRWGAGGWQSACCTTAISTYPLPMSTKRRGARIAGRKMSQGAFKKVLEKLAGEGYNLVNPIDLKTFWAKHGTNKFVTIR
ncbi:protein Barley B recombinant isoform X1 [Zea mays]|jgi:hypothetical protein|nr:Protein Barley B recombinant [Zea mays]XP_023158048.1 uncharacterized protein LOC100283491 isoform X1 [Zea mays]ACG37040.1 GAGA-binding protein [Zea mays]ACN35220.1 unknown [Zea mays]|eukprot:NP_001149863.1 uncharacterized protein LOC100283491 [Zea mays]